MDIQKAEKVKELLEEIKTLKKHKAFKDETTKHVQICKHYGDISHYDRICIPKRYNKRLFSLIDEIILEMESELSSL